MTNDIAVTLKPADGGPSARVVLVNPRYNGPGTEINPWEMRHSVDPLTLLCIGSIAFLTVCGNALLKR